jgi:hypothetical protein
MKDMAQRKSAVRKAAKSPKKARRRPASRPGTDARPVRRRAKGKRASANGSTEALGSRNAKGQFLPGNRFWAARSSAGPAPLFASSEDLWGACVEYFEWAAANPLYEDSLVTFQGSARHEPMARMQAMTIRGLCLFLDIEDRTWELWRKDRPDLAQALRRAEAVIYHQKFSGAAAGLLNPSIVARELALVDRTDLTATIETVDASPREEFTRRIAGIAARLGTAEGDSQPNGRGH